ncbi:MAG: DUF2855 family protein, partial [Chloroflexota bacterium]
NIHKSKFVSLTDTPTLEDQQILMKVSQFAFTANNVTYAFTGERLGYWQFFPSGEDGWGIIPVWGFGEVIESKHADIAVGERIYGYFPMASHLIVTAGKVNPYGFTDAAAHRQSLSPIYNRYVRADKAEGYDASLEAINSLLRPMFTTSFLIDDFFEDNDMFGAGAIILSSASSKTAYGTAFLLDANRNERPDYQVIGLTSKHNVPFVESLGCYDTVLAYGNSPELDASNTAAYIDFSGNLATRTTVHEHYGDNLLYDCSVGSTHWEQTGSTKGIPGVRPEFFFAPAQAEKRLKEWGRDGYQQKSTTAWLAFINQAQHWMDITPIAGQDAIQALYEAMVDGTSRPEKGYMMSL